MFNCLLNVQTGDTTPDGYVSLEINNATLIIFCIVFLIMLIALIILITYITLKHINDKDKKIISEKDKQILSEFQKLTPKEKQVIIDTIKTFNKTKDE